MASLTCLLVGGYPNIYRTLKRRLEALEPSIYIADFWGFERGQKSSYREIPKGIDFVLHLSTFTSHALSHNIAAACKKADVKLVQAPHKWSTLWNRLHLKGLLRGKEGKDMARITMPVAPAVKIVTPALTEKISMSITPAPNQQRENFKQKLTPEQVAQRAADVAQLLRSGTMASTITRLMLKKYGVAFSYHSVLGIARREKINVVSDLENKKRARDAVAEHFKTHGAVANVQVVADLKARGITIAPGLVSVVRKELVPGFDGRRDNLVVSVKQIANTAPTTTLAGVQQKVQAIFKEKRDAATATSDFKSALELLKEAMLANGISELVAYIDTDTGKLKTSMKRLTASKLEV